MINIKTEDEITKIRVACVITAEVRGELIKLVRSGITTGEIDNIAERLICEKNAIPAFKGYRGYKHATCISVNEEVVHGIPGDRRLTEGDIVGIDVGVCYEGYHGDSAVTVAVGRVSSEAQRLIQTTEKALYKAIDQIKEGRRLGDVSFAIESCAKKAGFSVVKDLYGHGIGKDLHEDPLIPNYGKRGEGVKLENGMVLAIEPMLNIGRYEIETLKDGWTIVTKDRSLSAHFEHTVLVNGSRTEILTKLR